MSVKVLSAPEQNLFKNLPTFYNHYKMVEYFDAFRPLSVYNLRTELMKEEFWLRNQRHGWCFRFVPLMTAGSNAMTSLSRLINMLLTIRHSPLTGVTRVVTDHRCPAIQGAVIGHTFKSLT